MGSSGAGRELRSAFDLASTSWLKPRLGQRRSSEFPSKTTKHIVMSAGQREVRRGLSYLVALPVITLPAMLGPVGSQSRARNVKSAGQPRTRLTRPASKPASKRQAAGPSRTNDPTQAVAKHPRRTLFAGRAQREWVEDPVTRGRTKVRKKEPDADAGGEQP